MKYRKKRIMRSVIACLLVTAFVLNMNINLWTVETMAEGVAGFGDEDFETCELLVVTDDASIFREPATILSEYDGVYLLGFENKETAIGEYYYYSEVALYAEPNSRIIKGADGESTPGDAESEESTDKETGKESEVNQVGEGPSENGTEESSGKNEGEEDSGENETKENTTGEESELSKEKELDGSVESEKLEESEGSEESDSGNLSVEELFSEDESEDIFSVIEEYDSEAVRGSIALIDTGAAGQNVVGSVSVLGGSSADDNGHGTKLLEQMVSENPEVRVFSIKALDSNCTGTVADVYAAIMLAVSCDVKIINLSMSSIKSAESEVLEQAVNEALAKGIKVVAAAGNKSMDASLFTPANIPGVITVGACDENGTIRKTSNFGECVDHYVYAESTSEAAAIMSAFLYLSNDESLGNNTPSPEGNSLEQSDVKDPLNNPLDVDNLLVGTAEGTVPMWNGLSDAGVTNWLTAVSTGSGRYYYTLTDGGGTDWNLYCIDPDKRCPVDDSVTMYARPLNASAIPSSWFRGVMAVLYYGKHAESTGKYSYNDWSSSFSGSTSTADRTHWAAAYASGWENSSSQYYADAVSNYNMCLSWLNSADPNGDGIFYVGNGGSSEGESGSEAYRSFLEGKGYHVVLDTNPSTNVACYQGFKVVDSSNENRTHSSNSSSGGSSAIISYSNGRQYTNWMKLVPYYTGTYDSRFAEQSVQFRVPSGTTVTVRSTSGSTKDYSEGQLVTVWGWYEFRLSAPISKSGSILSDGGTLRLDNRTLFIQGWVAEPDSGSYQRLAYAYTPDWNQYLSLGSWSPKGMITIEKKSQNPYNTPSMDGITYGLYSNANCTSRIGVYTISSDGTVKSVSVDDNNVGAYYDSGNSGYISGIPLERDFYIKEISKGNTSYKLNNHVYTAKLGGSSSGGVISVQADVSDTPYIYAEVKKSSANTFVSSDNPNYDLTGTTFTVYKNQACTEQVGTIRINGNDGSSSVLNLTEFLNVNSGTGLGEETTFYYKETVSGRGYISDAGVYSFKINPASLNKITLDIENSPYFMPVNISVAKKDDTENNVETSVSTLEGAEFTLRYYPQDITSIFDNKKAAKASMTFAVKKESDGSFKIDTKRSYLKSGSTDYFDANGNLKLPLGYITIVESAAPAGFTSDGFFTVKDKDGNLIQSDNGTFVLKVTAGGITTTTGKLISPSSFVKEDEPIRADIELTKHNLETLEPMEGVKFLVTNKETGQSVTICTDSDGYYSSSSSYIDHSVNTNCGEAASGTWFGDVSKIDNSKCALHAGTYTVKEMRTDSNGEKQLELVREIMVDKSVNGMTINVFDGSASLADGKNYNADKPEIHTMASVPEDEEQSEDLGEETEESQEEDEEIPQEDAAAVNKSLSTVSRDDFDVTDQTIVDTVYFNNLRAGKTYTLKAELMVVDALGEVTPYMEGEEQYVRYKTFEVDASYGKTIYEKTGEVEVILDGINPLGFEGMRFVVYETLYYGNREDVPVDDSSARQYEEYGEDDDMDIFPIEHKDPSDEDQTIRVPLVYTSASDMYTSDHVAYPGEVTTCTDVVYYSGLTPGKLYTVTGQLMIKKDSDEEETQDGEEIKENEGDEIEEQEDSEGDNISDGESEVDEESIDNDESEQEIPDNKEYEELLDKDGNPITSNITFVADSEAGSVELEFTFDASLLNGKTVVAFETLFRKGKEIAVHADINDEEESIHYPNIHTTSSNFQVAEDSASAKEVLAEQNAQIKDIVHYENLLADRKYLIRGTLVDRDSEEVIKDAEGKEIRGETVFVATSTDADCRCDGDIEVSFDEFDATTLKNRSAVIYEEIYLVTESTTIDEDGSIASSCRIDQIGEHKDKEDVDQFISFPEIGTDAKDRTTGIKQVPESDETVIEDTVTYKNLIPGEKYSLIATLHVKNDKSGFYSDGAVLLDKDGGAVTATITFTPEEADGEVVVKIPLNTEGLSDLDLVAFERLKNDLDIEVAMHEDIADEGQTVHVAGGKTLAINKETSTHYIEPEKDQKIIDKVYYFNLIPGVSYTVTGVLMDKHTGEAITENGKEVTSTLEFVPEEKDGFVVLEFTVNAENLAEKTIVVFETVTYEGITIFSHKDLEDEDQSIYVNPKPIIDEKKKESEEESEIYSKKEENRTDSESETDTSKDATVTGKDSTEIKTGDVINIAVIIAICMLSFAGMYIIYLRRKRKI